VAFSGGVSFVLPDVRFGVVSQDWVTIWDRVHGNLTIRA